MRATFARKFSLVDRIVLLPIDAVLDVSCLLGVEEKIKSQPTPAKGGTERTSPPNAANNPTAPPAKKGKVRSPRCLCPAALLR